MQAPQGLYCGGWGEARITAVTAMPNGNLAVAGVTSSPDLPSANGLQAVYGGGASDAFVAQFSADLQKLLYGTFVGGTGAEESLALASNVFNELLVGGWTNSADFPASGGLDAACGRGAGDGFLVNPESGGSPIYSHCDGGTGRGLSTP